MAFNVSDPWVTLLTRVAVSVPVPDGLVSLDRTPGAATVRVCPDTTE